MSSKVGKAVYWIIAIALVFAAIAIPTYLVKNTINSLENKLSQANNIIGTQKQSIDELKQSVADLNKQIRDWKKSAEVNNASEEKTNRIEKISNKIYNQKQAVVRSKIAQVKSDPNQSPDQVSAYVSAVLIDDLWSNHCKMTKDASSPNCATIPITP